MRRAPRFIAVTALALLTGWAASRTPEWLREWDLFALEEVKVEGSRFVTADEVIRTAAFPEGANIWDARDPIRARVEAHPLIAEAEVHRLIPAGIRLVIREVEPVALAANPLQPVDASGRLLPLDPTEHPLNLPVLRLREPPVDAETGAPSPEARVLAREADMLTELDPEIAGRLSELWMAEDGSMAMALTDPQVEILYRAPITVRMLDRGLQMLQHALEEESEATPGQLDLRWADQVVVRLADHASNHSP